MTDKGDSSSNTSAASFETEEEKSESVSYEEETLSVADAASSAISSQDDDDDDDESTVTPPSSSRFNVQPSSWRKSVKSVEAELRESSHHNSISNGRNGLDSESIASEKSNINQKRLFGGPAEFGGSQHSSNGAFDDEKNNELYRKLLMTRTTNGSNHNHSKNAKETATNGKEIGDGQGDATNSSKRSLESSPFKLAVEDELELQDMLVDDNDSANNEELERSFRKVVSPGHVRANRDFYETLKDNQIAAEAAPVNLLDDDDDSDDQSDDDYGTLKEQAASDQPNGSKRNLSWQSSTAAASAPVEDEETQVMILERRAEKARGDPSDYHSSQEDLENISGKLFEDLGNDSDKGDDDDNNDKDDTSNEKSSEAGGEEESGESDDSKTADDEEDSSTDGDDENDSDDTDDEKNDSAGWNASVVEEDNEMDRSRESRGFDESDKTSFRRQKELMNNSRLQTSEREMDVPMDLSHKASRHELREDLEAQVKERIQTKDEDTQRELEKSLHRVRSDSSGKDEESQTDEEKVDISKPPPKKDTPPVTTITKKKSRLEQAGNAMSSMKCIYILFACVCLMVVGVIILAVFFAQAD